MKLVSLKNQSALSFPNRVHDPKLLCNRSISSSTFRGPFSMCFDSSFSGFLIRLIPLIFPSTFSEPFLNLF
jgi:hypothetical protein